MFTSVKEIISLNSSGQIVIHYRNNRRFQRPVRIFDAPFSFQKSYFVVVAMLFHKSNYDGGRRNMIIRA